MKLYSSKDSWVAEGREVREDVVPFANFKTDILSIQRWKEGACNSKKSMGEGWIFQRTLKIGLGGGGVLRRTFKVPPPREILLLQNICVNKAKK